MILVTGGAGFIGSNIVETLVRSGQHVRVLDNLSTGKRSNLEHLISEIDFIEGDLRDRTTLAQAIKNVTHIIHQGALPSVPLSIEQPLKTHACNVEGTLNLLYAAKEAHVKRVVFASSSSVYGNTPTLPKHEDMIPTPLSPYALQKWIGEKYCHLFHALYNLETVSLRYFNVFGPRQNPNSAYAAVIPNFIGALLKNESPIIYGDGEQTRDFTYVQNVVTANLSAMESDGVSGEVINIANHQSTSINALLQKIQDILKTSIPAIYRSERPGDVKHSLADITRAKERLRYSCQVSLEEGLRQTVAWYQTHIRNVEEEVRNHDEPHLDATHMEHKMCAHA